MPSIRRPISAPSSARPSTTRDRAVGASNGPAPAVEVKLAPHLHVLLLDGVFREQGDDVVFHALPHLGNRDVAEVLERTIARMTRYLDRRGLLADDGDGGRDLADDPTHPNAAVSASAVTGATPPSGPEIRRGNVLPRPVSPLRFEKPLCVAKDGFTLHAATRAGAQDAAGGARAVRPQAADRRETRAARA